MWARKGFDLTLQAHRACRGWSSGLLKKKTKKVNANLNRLVNADFSFEVNASEEVAVLA